MLFGLLVRGGPYCFLFPETSGWILSRGPRSFSSRLLCFVVLIRGSLIRTRGRALLPSRSLSSRKTRVLSVSFPRCSFSFSFSLFSSSLSLARALYARQKARVPFKRYNRVALWKLMHSIVDLCTIHMEYIGTLPVYEINFVHAPLASRPCNYQ